MRAVLVDDESRSIDNLTKLLVDYCPSVSIEGTASNVDDACKLITNSKPELVFLDIDMPPYTGFDLLRKFDKIPFEIIFVTAYDFYAIDAIRFSALDYILKPIKITELKSAISRADSKISTNIDVLSSYLDSISDDKQIDRIVVNSMKGSHLLEFKNVIYLEADNVYTIFHMKDGKTITCSQKRLKDYESMLEEKGFYRVHRTYMVNLQYVESIESNEGLFVVLKNIIKLPLARRRKDDFLRLIN